eukprot:g5397.t1
MHDMNKTKDDSPVFKDAQFANNISTLTAKDVQLTAKDLQLMQTSRASKCCTEHFPPDVTQDIAHFNQYLDFDRKGYAADADLTCFKVNVQNISHQMSLRILHSVINISTLTANDVQLTAKDLQLMQNISTLTAKDVQLTAKDLQLMQTSRASKCCTEHFPPDVTQDIALFNQYLDFDRKGYAADADLTCFKVNVQNISHQMSLRILHSVINISTLTANDVQLTAKDLQLMQNISTLTAKDVQLTAKDLQLMQTSRASKCCTEHFPPDVTQDIALFNQYLDFDRKGYAADADLTCFKVNVQKISHQMSLRILHSSINISTLTANDVQLTAKDLQLMQNISTLTAKDVQLTAKDLQLMQTSRASKCCTEHFPPDVTQDIAHFNQYLDFDRKGYAADADLTCFKVNVQKISHQMSLRILHSSINISTLTANDVQLTAKDLQLMQNISTLTAKDVQLTAKDLQLMQTSRASKCCTEHFPPDVTQDIAHFNQYLDFDRKGYAADADLTCFKVNVQKISHQMSLRILHSSINISTLTANDVQLTAKDLQLMQNISTLTAKDVQLTAKDLQLMQTSRASKCCTEHFPPDVTQDIAHFNPSTSFSLCGHGVQNISTLTAKDMQLMQNISTLTANDVQLTAKDLQLMQHFDELIVMANVSHRPCILQTHVHSSASTSFSLCGHGVQNISTLTAKDLQLMQNISTLQAKNAQFANNISTLTAKDVQLTAKDLQLMQNISSLDSRDGWVLAATGGNCNEACVDARKDACNAFYHSLVDAVQCTMAKLGKMRLAAILHLPYSKRVRRLHLSHLVT